VLYQCLNEGSLISPLSDALEWDSEQPGPSRRLLYHEFGGVARGLSAKATRGPGSGAGYFVVRYRLHPQHVLLC
jgi:hypothetical protein